MAAGTMQGITTNTCRPLPLRCGICLPPTTSSQGISVTMPGTSPKVLIVYSLGNFVFDHFRTDWGESFILQVNVPREGPPSGEIIPVYLAASGVPSPVTGSAANITLNRLTTLSAALGLKITRSGDRAFFGY